MNTRRDFFYYILGVLGVIILTTLFYNIFIREEIKENVETALQEEGKLKVAATIFPLYDIARNISGQDAQVELLLPPGATPHFFEFSPQQLSRLQGTKVIFAIGHGLDNWSLKVKNVLNGAKVVVVDEGIQLRTSDSGIEDPHYWLNFKNAQIIAFNIANTLAEIAPHHSQNYRLRAEEYIKRLRKKEAELKNSISGLPKNDIVVLHDAWFYFADNFGLNIIGSFEPSVGREPTPRYLSELSEAIENSKTKVIFVEPQFNLGSIKSFADDNSLRIYILDPLGGSEGRDSFIKLMEYNINTVLRALQSN